MCLLNLLAGHWPQQDHGLFDRTHLRWFTRESMVALMQACGLVVHDITPRVFRPEQAKALVDALKPVLPQLGVDPQALLAGVSPLQYVIRAGQQPVQPLLLSGLLLRPQLGLNEVRMIHPLRSVASAAGCGGGALARAAAAAAGQLPAAAAGDLSAPEAHHCRIAADAAPGAAIRCRAGG